MVVLRHEPNEYDPAQICPLTGLTVDYVTEFYAVRSLLDRGLGLADVADRIRERPLKTYEERFPKDEFPAENEMADPGRIAFLNQLVRYANIHMIYPNRFTIGELRGLIDEAHNAITDEGPMPRVTEEKAA